MYNVLVTEGRRGSEEEGEEGEEGVCFRKL